MDNQEIRTVGYWYNNYDADAKHLPMPVAKSEPWEGQQAFIEKLISIETPLMLAYQAYVDQWNANIGIRGAIDPVRPKTVESYRGDSRCRCCDMSNGCREFTYMGWRWPQGYIHYLRDHNVLPDEDFKRFIMEHQIGGVENGSSSPSS